MNRLSAAVLLAALPLAAGQPAAPSDKILYKDAFVNIVTPDDATTAQAKAVVKVVKDAWKLDLSIMRWANPGVMSGPITVRLLSEERMNREHNDARAVTKGHKFDIRIKLLENPRIGVTFAHELGHVQAFYVLGKHGNAMPHYFLEGHGLMMNLLYCEAFGLRPDGCSVIEAKQYAKITAEEAHAIFSDPEYYRTGTQREKSIKTNQMELMGLYLVEYLRSRRHIADAVPKMARVFESVGEGRTFEQAFARVYGVSVNKVTAEITALFERTQSNPADRLAGTRFAEDLAKSADSKS